MPAAPRSGSLRHPPTPKENRQRKGLLQTRPESRLSSTDFTLCSLPPRMPRPNPKPSRIILTVIVTLIPWLTGCCIACDPKRPQPRPGWTLVWSDEFSTPDGSSPDPKKWTYDLGGKGWGNHELESYTNRRENAHIENGNLVITAQKE